MKKMEPPLVLSIGRTLLVAGLACQLLGSLPARLHAQAVNKDAAARILALDERVHALEAELQTLRAPRLHKVSLVLLRFSRPKKQLLRLSSKYAMRLTEQKFAV